MRQLATIITLCTLLSLILFSCGKDDEPEVIPPQGYLVLNDGDTLRFDNLQADRVMSDTEPIYQLDVKASSSAASVKFSILSNEMNGLFNDKRCAGCVNNPAIEIVIPGGTYNSGTCYINNTTLNTFTAELFYNKKADAETVLFEGTLCQPTSDTTFITLKVKGVLQDAPF